MNSSLKLRFSFRVVALILLGLQSEGNARNISAAQVDVVVNQVRSNVQQILVDNTPPNTKLKNLTATATQLNALAGISGTVTAANLNTLTAGTASVADSLHTHVLAIADASTLDTLDSTQFIRSDVSDSFTGTTLTMSGDLLMAAGTTLISATNTDVAISPNGTGIVTIGTLSNITGLNLAGDLTLGVGTPPTIHLGGGQTVLNIFNPSNAPFAKTLNIRGDLSLTGTLFTPSIFEMRMDMRTLQTAMTVQVEQRQALETRLAAVKNELIKIREIPFEVTSLPIINPDIISGLYSDIEDEPVTLKRDLIVEGTIIEQIVSPTMGIISLHADQSLRPYLTERGESHLRNGEGAITLSNAFVSLVEITKDKPLFVKLTLLSESCHEIAVIERATTYFRVKELYQGTSNCPFLWEVSAHKGDKK